MGVGPSTKETSLHHFRDPLLNVLSEDTDLDLAGIIIVGTPQDNVEKERVGQRAAQILEAMRVDGCIVSCDGWGNSHVDYANTFEEIGSRGIGKFVVSNKYMDTIVDMSKSKDGTETEVVGENAIDTTDARKAVAFLKLKMRKAQK